MWFIGIVTGNIPLVVLILCVLLVKCLPRFLSLCAQHMYPGLVCFKQIPNGIKVVALTIDGSPRLGQTLHILNTVLDFGAKATFFMSGDSVSHYRHADKLLLKIADSGCELAIQGTQHASSTRDIRREIRRTSKRLHKYLTPQDSRHPRWFRPWSGSISREVMIAAGESKHSVSLGTIYTADPALPFPHVNCWFMKNLIRSGDIISLPDDLWTIPLLKMLLVSLRDGGFQVVTLTKLHQMAST